MKVRLITDFSGLYHVVDIQTGKILKFSLSFSQVTIYVESIKAVIV